MDTMKMKNSISFSGCGFLGIYHVGVASCLKEYAPHLYENKIIGASAGALVSSALLSGCCLGECTTFVLKLVMDARSRALGPLSPRFTLVSNLRGALNKFLPDDAHKLVSNKLHVSLTRVSDNKNVLASDFRNKEELINCLICSSFVPFYSGVFPPKFKGVHYIDGGLTDNLPIYDDQTITVSPFAGESDICPDDLSYNPHVISLAGTSVQLTSNNIYRLSVAFFPPAPEVLSDMCRRGFADALRFLKKNRLISCQKHVSIHSALISLKTLDIDEIIKNDNDDVVMSHHRNLKRLRKSADQAECFYDDSANMQSNLSKEDVMLEINDEYGKNYEELELDVDENMNNDDDEYDDDDDDDSSVCTECVKRGYDAFKDLPPMAVQQALQAALDEERNGYLSNLYRWKAFRLTSLMFVPYTLPIEVSLMVLKSFLNWAPNLCNDAHWFFSGFYNLCKNFLHLNHDDQSASELSTWLSSYGQYLGLIRSNTKKKKVPTATLR